MTEDNFNTYELIINEDDEIMLLLYSQEGAPEKPVLEISPESNQAVLYRSKTSGIEIKDIPEENIDMLCDIDKILVCELSAEADEDNTQITNVYEATINII